MAICRLIVKYSLIFPGQASQRVGMGSDLIGRWPEAARIYDIAEDVAGIPVGKLCFEGPEEELVRTANLQPCVVATSLAILAAAYSEANLNIGDCFASAPFPPFAVAGHSVGEYSALAAAGVITISTCLSLVAERARLMQRAADSNPGTMLARRYCRECRRTLFCNKAESSRELFTSSKSQLVRGDCYSW